MSVDLVVSTISIIVTIIISIATLSFWLGRKFQEVEDRFREVDNRFREIDKRFDSLKTYIDERFNFLKNYVDERFNSLKSYVDERFDSFKNYVDERFSRLIRSFQVFHEFFIEYLSTESVIPKRSKDLLLTELRGVLRLAVNPMSKEELEKIKYYLEKDPDTFTLEEAYEFLELARKFAWEYGDRVEPWKLHIYAAMVVGWTIRRKWEEEEKQKREERQETK